MTRRTITALLTTLALIAAPAGAAFAADDKGVSRTTFIVGPPPAPPTTLATMQAAIGQCTLKVGTLNYTTTAYLYFSTSNGYRTAYKGHVVTNYPGGAYTDFHYNGISRRVSVAAGDAATIVSYLGWRGTSSGYMLAMGFSNPGPDKQCTIRGSLR